MSSIWIPISDELYATHNTSVNANILHDDGSQKWLRLRIPPDGYQPIYENLGSAGIVRGLFSRVILTPVRAVGFEITTPESREVVRHIAESLLNQVVTVRDYVAVESADIATGYTERQVVVRQPQSSGSLTQGSSRYHVGGFVLSFEGV
ncbi:MAG: hypothetical protein AAGA75_23025 [Cyanobacteria bacterium P01_E01_bin.6]